MPRAATDDRALRARVSDGLRRALRRHPGLDSQVDDLVQEALWRATRSAHRFRGEASWVGYVVAIAVRLALDEVRHARWRDVSLDALVQPGGVAVAEGGVPGEERGVDRTSVMRVLDEALDTLTPRQRTAIVAELRGMPQAELALRLGTSRGALYKLCHDARRKLRAALESRGITAEHVSWAFDA